MALSMVTSSVYSMSLPTGIPMAMRVTRRSLPLQLLGEVGGGGFALDRGIGREDHFFDFSARRRG